MKIAILLVLLAVTYSLSAPSDVNQDTTEQTHSEAVSTSSLTPTTPSESPIMTPSEGIQTTKKTRPKPKRSRWHYPEPVAVPCDKEYPETAKCWWHPAPVYLGDY